MPQMKKQFVKENRFFFTKIDQCCYFLGMMLEVLKYCTSLYAPKIQREASIEVSHKKGPFPDFQGFEQDKEKRNCLFLLGKISSRGD